MSVSRTSPATTPPMIELSQLPLQAKVGQIPASGPSEGPSEAQELEVSDPFATTRIELTEGNEKNKPLWNKVQTIANDVHGLIDRARQIAPLAWKGLKTAGTNLAKDSGPAFFVGAAMRGAAGALGTSITVASGGAGLALSAGVGFATRLTRELTEAQRKGTMVMAKRHILRHEETAAQTQQRVENIAKISSKLGKGARTWESFKDTGAGKSLHFVTHGLEMAIAKRAYQGDEHAKTIRQLNIDTIDTLNQKQKSELANAAFFARATTNDKETREKAFRVYKAIRRSHGGLVGQYGPQSEGMSQGIEQRDILRRSITREAKVANLKIALGTASLQIIKAPIKSIAGFVSADVMHKTWGLVKNALSHTHSVDGDNIANAVAAMKRLSKPIQVPNPGEHAATPLDINVVKDNIAEARNAVATQYPEAALDLPEQTIPQAQVVDQVSKSLGGGRLFKQEMPEGVIPHLSEPEVRIAQDPSEVIPPKVVEAPDAVTQSVTKFTEVPVDTSGSDVLRTYALNSPEAWIKHPQNELSLHTIKEKGSILLDMGNMKGVDFVHKPDTFGFSVSLPGDLGSVLILQDVSVENGVKIGLGKMRLDPQAPITDVVRVMRSDGKIDQLPRAVISKLLINTESKVEVNGQITKFEHLKDGQFTSYGSDLLRARAISAVQIDADASGHLHATSHATSLYKESPLPTVSVAEAPPKPVQPMGVPDSLSEHTAELRVPQIHPRNDPDNPIYNPLQRSTNSEVQPIPVAPSDEQKFGVPPSSSEQWSGATATVSAKKIPGTGEISGPVIKSPLHPDRNVVMGPKTTSDLPPSDVDQPQNTQSTILDVGSGKRVNPDHISPNEDDVVARIEAELRAVRSIPGNQEIDFPQLKEVQQFGVAIEELKALDILDQLHDSITTQSQLSPISLNAENNKFFHELLSSSRINETDLIDLKKSLKLARIDVKTLSTLVELSLVENPKNPSLLVRSLSATLNGTSRNDHHAFILGMQQLAKDPVTLQSLVKNHIRTNNLQWDVFTRPELQEVRKLVPVVAPETLKDKLDLLNTLGVTKNDDDQIQALLSNTFAISPITKDIMLVRGGVTEVLGNGYGMLHFANDNAHAEVGKRLVELANSPEFFQLMKSDELVRRLYFASITDPEGKLLKELIANPACSTELIRKFANDPDANLIDVRFDKLIAQLQKGDATTYKEILNLLKNSQLGDTVSRNILMNDNLLNSKDGLLRQFLTITNNIKSSDDVVRTLYAYPQLFGVEDLTLEKMVQISHGDNVRQLPIMFDEFNKAMVYEDGRELSRNSLQKQALEVLKGQKKPLDFIKQLRMTDKVAQVQHGNVIKVEDFKTMIMNERSQFDDRTRNILSFIEGADKVAPMGQYEYTWTLAKNFLRAKGGESGGGSDPYVQLVEMMFGGLKKPSLDRTMGDPTVQGEVKSLFFGFRHPEKYSKTYLIELWTRLGENPLVDSMPSAYRDLWKASLQSNTDTLISTSTPLAGLIAKEFGFDITDPGKVNLLCARFESVLMAKELSKHMTPQEVFDAYLNIAPMGMTKGGAEIRGIGAAARLFLHKDVDDLTDVERIALIGITNRPADFSPFANKETNPIENMPITLRALFDEAYPGQNKPIPTEFTAGQKIPLYKNRAVVLLTETLRGNFSAKERADMIVQLSKMQMDHGDSVVSGVLGSEDYIKQLRGGMPVNTTAYFPGVGYVYDKSDKSPIDIALDKNTGSAVALLQQAISPTAESAKQAAHAVQNILKTAVLDPNGESYSFGQIVHDANRSPMQIPVFEQVGADGGILKNPGMSLVSIGPNLEMIEKFDPSNVLNKGAIAPASTIKPLVAVMYELFGLPIDSMVNNAPAEIPGGVTVANATHELDWIPQMPLTEALKQSSNVPFVKPFQDILQEHPEKWLEVQAIMSAFGLQFTEDINGTVPLTKTAPFTSIGSSYVVGIHGESGMHAMAQAYSRLFNAEKYFAHDPKLLAAAQKVRDYMMSEQYVSGVNVSSGKPFMSHALGGGYALTTKTGSLLNTHGNVSDYYTVGVVQRPDGQYDAMIIRVAGQKVTTSTGAQAPLVSRTNLFGYPDMTSGGVATLARAIAEERVQSATVTKTTP